MFCLILRHQTPAFTRRLASVSESVDCIQQLWSHYARGRVTKEFNQLLKVFSLAPRMGRKVQAELAPKPLGFLPIHACLPAWLIEVTIDHKTFLLGQRSAFALAWTYLLNYSLLPSHKRKG